MLPDAKGFELHVGDHVRHAFAEEYSAHGTAKIVSIEGRVAILNNVLGAGMKSRAYGGFMLIRNE